MPRLSGAREPPALQPRAGGAAPIGALAVPVAQRAEAAAAPAAAPALAVVLPAPAVPPAAEAQQQRAWPLAAAAPEAVPPPPEHPFLKEPRLYRQPDGSLSATKPPPDPYTVAARRAWADLVHYARVHGGDDECAAGRSFRYGVGVSYAQHAAYLASLGLAPERGADGAWFGFDPARTDPLADEAHPFNAAARAAVRPLNPQ